jgi:hypothetical protein
MPNEYKKPEIKPISKDITSKLQSEGWKFSQEDLQDLTEAQGEDHMEAMQEAFGDDYSTGGI